MHCPGPVLDPVVLQIVRLAAVHTVVSNAVGHRSLLRRALVGRERLERRIVLLEFATFDAVVRRDALKPPVSVAPCIVAAPMCFPVDIASLVFAVRLGTRRLAGAENWQKNLAVYKLSVHSCL